MNSDDKPNQGELILYQTPEGTVRIEVAYEDETFWLSQKRMAELFAVEVNTVNYHLKEIFKTGELDENSVIRKIRITADDGKDYLTNVYNLDAIISVGYRVNSVQATRFRIWATQTLREFPKMLNDVYSAFENGLDGLPVITLVSLPFACLPLWACQREFVFS